MITGWSVTHGEILALIIASILTSSSNLHSSSPLQHPSSSCPSVTIFSDHLQSVHLISNICSNALLPNFWVSKLAQSYYHWLSMLVVDNPQLIFQHIKSHTNLSNNPSTLNQMVDELAAAAHADLYTWFAPLPSFALDCYALWKEGTGFIENNVMLFIEDELAIFVQ